MLNFRIKPDINEAKRQTLFAAVAQGQSLYFHRVCIEPEDANTVLTLKSKQGATVIEEMVRLKKYTLLTDLLKHHLPKKFQDKAWLTAYEAAELQKSKDAINALIDSDEFSGPRFLYAVKMGWTLAAITLWNRESLSKKLDLTKVVVQIIKSGHISLFDTFISTFKLAASIRNMKLLEASGTSEMFDHLVENYGFDATGIKKPSQSIETDDERTVHFNESLTLHFSSDDDNSEEKPERDFPKVDKSRHAFYRRAIALMEANEFNQFEALIKKCDHEVNEPLDDDNNDLFNLCILHDRWSFAQRLTVLRKIDLKELQCGGGSRQYRNPMHLATRQSHEQMYEFLQTQGFKFDERDSRGNTPFMIAAKYGKVDAMRYLAGRGLYNGPDPRNQMACLIAPKRDKEALQRYEAGQGGIYLKATNDKNQTALHLASLSNELAAVKLLVEEFGLDPDQNDGDEKSSYAIALLSKESDVANYFISTSKKPVEQIVLHGAGFKSGIALPKVLKSCQYDAKTTFNDGTTLLECVAAGAEEIHTETFWYLIDQKGCDPFAVAKSGFNFMDLLAHLYDKDYYSINKIIEMILISRQRRTPDLALFSPEVISFVLRYATPVWLDEQFFGRISTNIQDVRVNGRTLLHELVATERCVNDRLQKIEMLLVFYGVSPYAEDECGQDLFAYLKANKKYDLLYEIQAFMKKAIDTKPAPPVVFRSQSSAQTKATSRAVSATSTDVADVTKALEKSKLN